MIGMDNHKRPFIIVKFRCNGKQTINCFFNGTATPWMNWHVVPLAIYGLMPKMDILSQLEKQNIKWIYQYNFWKEAPDNLSKLEIDTAPE